MNNNNNNKNNLHSNNNNAKNELLQICYICKKYIKKNDIISMLKPCQDVFHEDCIQDLKDKKMLFKCPLC